MVTLTVIDYADEAAARALPCTCDPHPLVPIGPWHDEDCPFGYRPAVAAEMRSIVLSERAQRAQAVAECEAHWRALVERCEREANNFERMVHEKQVELLQARDAYDRMKASLETQLLAAQRELAHHDQRGRELLADLEVARARGEKEADDADR